METSIKLKPCPFCGKTPNGNYPHLSYVPLLEKWNFNHTCISRKDFRFDIDLYGASKEEVIQKWNERA